MASASTRLSVLLLLLTIVPIGVAKPPKDTPQVIAKAKALAAKADLPALEKLIGERGIAIYEGFDELLLSSDPQLVPITNAIAQAYQRRLTDDCLIRRSELVRGWSQAQRAVREQALGLKQQALTAFGEGRNKEAQAAFERARELFHELGDRRNEGKMIGNLGAVATTNSRDDEALELFTRAEPLVREAGDRVQLVALLANRAYALDNLGDVEGTLTASSQALESARALGDTEGVGQLLVNRGTVFARIGKTAEAIAAYVEAAEIARREGDAELESVLWFDVSALDEQTGDQAAATAHLKLSLEIARRAKSPLRQIDALSQMSRMARRVGSVAQARALLNEARRVAVKVDHPQVLGMLDYAEGLQLTAESQYAKAIPYFDAAERRLDATDAGLPRATIVGDRAITWFFMGDYARAIDSLRTAAVESAAAVRPGGEAEQRWRLGMLLSTLGDDEQALQEMQRAVELYRQVQDLDGVATALDAMGWLRYHAGDLAGARKLLEQALQTSPQENGPITHAETLKDLAMVELADGVEHRARGMELLTQSREAFFALDDITGILDLSLLEAHHALDTKDLAAARAAMARATQAARGRTRPEMLWRQLDLEGRVARSAGDQAAAIQAFRSAVAEVEKHRGSVRPAPWRAAILEDRIAPYRALTALLHERGDNEEAYRVARLAKARTFVESLAPPDPGLTDEGREPTVPGGLVPPPLSANSSLRAALLANEALLDFFFTDDALLVFVMRRESLRAFEFPIDTLELSTLCTSTRWPGHPVASEAAVTQAWDNATTQLGRLLLDPLADLLAGVDRLLIVPNGPLHGVPFAALQLRGKRLIETTSVAILPAAEALLSRRPRPTRERYSMLAIGDPAGTREGRLPGAAEEARRVAAQSSHRGEVATGADASEASFRKRAAAFDRIHLAAHGTIDTVSPVHSYVAMTPGGGADGRLEVSEIARLRLRAQLVVLSGCDTGVEQGMVRGAPLADERMSLARAFLVAGSASVIANLWETSDKAAREIMPALYARLLSRSSAEALATLQRDLASGQLRGEQGVSFEHPYYWAGLVNYGPGDSPATVPSVVSR